LRALLRSPDVQVERNAAHETILIEGFIPGREYAVEGLVHHGHLHVLAIFDKPDPLDGPFFEETIYVAPSAATDAEQLAITATTPPPRRPTPTRLSRSASAMAPHTPSVGLMNRRCSCSRSRRGRSEASARARFASSINPKSKIQNPKSLRFPWKNCYSATHS